jgi:O-antigen/teichoic acid export membrane protein
MLLTITMFIGLFVDEFFSIPMVWLYVIPIISIMSIVNQLNLTILRNEQRAKMFALYEVSNMVLKFSITIFFLVVMLESWYAQVYGVLITSVIFFLIAFSYMIQRSYIKLKLDQEKVKSILKISIPMIPYSLSGIVILMSDRLFIENMVGISEVGLYSVGYSFGMIVMLFTDAFIKAWSPWFYRLLKDDTIEHKRTIVKYSYVYLIGLFIIALSVSHVATLILPYFVDSKFYSAQDFIFWIAIAFAIRGVYQLFFPYLVHIGRTNLLAISMFVASVVNLVLNYWFIKLFGTIGAAYSTVIAFFISSLMMFIYQQRFYRMPWLYFRKTDVN